MRLKVSDVAEKMGKSEQFVRVGLQRGTLPFGTAVKVSSKWSYFINEHQFKVYCGEIPVEDRFLLLEKELCEIKKLLRQIKDTLN